jgi:hypothetical protein
LIATRSQLDSARVMSCVQCSSDGNARYEFWSALRTLKDTGRSGSCNSLFLETVSSVTVPGTEANCKKQAPVR